MINKMMIDWKWWAKPFAYMLQVVSLSKMITNRMWLWDALVDNNYIKKEKNRKDERIKTLVMLLVKYESELPKEICLQLDICANNEIFEYGNKDIEMLIAKTKIKFDITHDEWDFKVIGDGNEIHHITSVNPILKEISCYPYKGDNPVVLDGRIVTNKLFPEKMQMTFCGHVIMEW